LARAAHPNVVTVFDVVDDLRQPETDALCGAVIMEFVEGEPLEQRLARDSALEPAQARAICDGLLGALTHLHDLGQVHGDLHSGNVILTSDGPKVIDAMFDATVSRSTATLQGKVAQDVDACTRLIADVVRHANLDAHQFLLRAAARTMDSVQRGIEVVFAAQGDAGARNATSSPAIPPMPVAGNERLAKWEARGQLPERELFWDPGPHAFMWLAPASRLDKTWSSHELSKIERRGRAMLPRLFESEQQSSARCPKGFVVFPVPEHSRNGVDLVDSFTLVTPNANVWAIDGSVCRHTDDLGGAEIMFAPVSALEDRLTRGTERAIRYLQEDLGVDGPYAWAAGIRSITNIRLGIGRRFSRPFSDLPDLDEVWESAFINTRDEANGCLRRLLVRIWEAFGIDRPSD
jgi:hypothetical protein